MRYVLGVGSGHEVYGITRAACAFVAGVLAACSGNAAPSASPKPAPAPSAVAPPSAAAPPARIPSSDPDRRAEPAIGATSKSSVCPSDARSVVRVVDPTYCEAPRAVFFHADDCLLGTRVSPISVDGRPIGFRNDHIGPHSILGLCGVRSGDVWTAINGRSLATPDDALTLYPQLIHADKLMLQLLRDGRPHTVEIALR